MRGKIKKARSKFIEEFGACLICVWTIGQGYSGLYLIIMIEIYRLLGRRDI